MAFRKNYSRLKGSAPNVRKSSREDPDSAEAQRDLMVSYVKLGIVFDALKKPDKILNYFERGLNIARSLARDTANQQAQNNLEWFEGRVLQYQTKQGTP